MYKNIWIVRFFFKRNTIWTLQRPQKRSPGIAREHGSTSTSISYTSCSHRISSLKKFYNNFSYGDLQLLWQRPSFVSFKLIHIKTVCYNIQFPNPIGTKRKNIFELLLSLHIKCLTWHVLVYGPYSLGHHFTHESITFPMFLYVLHTDNSEAWFLEQENLIIKWNT